MALVRGQLENEAKTFGIAVVDVRIRRAGLPEQNSQAVYQRMQTERQRQAAGFRAEGSQHSLEIRAKADREVTVLIAQATAASEQVRGDGDTARNRIYAAAYERDPEFFTFYRTMQAYENALPARNTRMLLTLDSNFFRYFGDPMGKIRRRKDPR
jgi:membrane protease subunit HflC